MEEAEAVFGYERSAVQSHTADGFGCPDGVAGEELVVFRGTQEANHAQFHDQVVNHFLRFAFGDDAVFQVALDVDVKEGGDAAKAHRSAVLRFDGGEVGEVGPLYGFFGVGGRAGDVIAVAGGHVFHLAEGAVLFADFFTQTDDVFQVFACFQVGLQGVELAYFVGHEEVDAVEGDAAVVADDAATAVSIRQTGQYAGFAAAADVRGIDVKYALVVGFAVFGEGFGDLLVQRGFVDAAGIHDHLDAAVGHDGAFQRLIGLQADDDFKVFVDVARGVAVDAGDDVGVDFQRGFGAVFFFDAHHDAVPQFGGSRGGGGEEGAVAFIRRVVLLDEVTHVHAGFPVAGNEIGPSGRAVFSFCQHSYCYSYFKIKETCTEQARLLPRCLVF